MSLAMAAPFRHPKTGIFWLRKRVPADLVALLRRKEVRYSLKTRDPSEAKRLCAEELIKLDSQWQAARQGLTAEVLIAPDIVSLTEREAHERAAWLFNHWLEKHRANPSQQTFWRTDLYDQLWPKRTAAISDPATRTGAIWQTVSERMQADRLVSWCFDEADDVLALHDLHVDEASRLRLARAVAAAVQRASLVLAREAEGDFDEAAAIHVPSAADRAARSKAPAPPPVTFESLFQAWAAERKPAAKTLYEWHRVVAELEQHMGFNDAGRLTAEHLVAWKGSLIEQGRRPKTIRDAKLAPVRAILQWAVDNQRLPINPASRITIGVRARAGEGQRSFSDDEAKLVLRAAEGERDPVRRWIPWLCAYSGARVSEICQLRKEDVLQIEEIWCMKFDPEAGPLKNRASERVVPLHRALLDAGFLEFAAKAEPGPLFPELPPDKFGKRGGNGTKVLGRWVRALGLTDPRLSPNHSWRHRFKTLSRRFGLSSDIVDAMTGHTPRTVGDTYGEFPIAALKRELEKMPSLLNGGGL